MITRLSTHLFVLGLVLGTHVARGQAVSFVRHLSGVQPSESAVAVTRDSTGIYAVTSEAVRKLDSTGAAIWMRPVRNGRGVAGNGSGVYVAGVTSQALPGEEAYSLQDVFVQRYDSDGNLLWTHQFGTAGDDDVRGVAADATGVYVAGMSLQSLPVGYLRKYDPLGNLLWERSSPTIVQSVAVSADGVYIALISNPAGKSRSLVKYDAAGTELWTREFGDSAFFSTITATSAGLFAAGMQLSTAGSTSHPFLARYDSDGAELWTRPILNVSPGQPFVLDLAADDDGVYFAATGTIPNPCPSGGQDQIAMMYGLDGSEVWRMQFGSYGDDHNAGIASDGSGLYVLGTHADGVVLAGVAKRPEEARAPIPRITWGCVLNAASLIGGAVAPGEIVTILGTGMGPQEAAKADLATGVASRSLAGVSVLFNGIAAPLLMVSGERITAIVPHAVEVGSPVDIQVEYQGVRSSSMTFPVQSSRMGLFSQDGFGTGAGAVLNQDGTLNSPSNPAERGTIVSLYGTGAGRTDALVADGTVIISTPPPNLTSSVFAALGPLGDNYLDDSDYAQVVSAGLVTGSVDGLAQINIKLDVFITPGVRSLHLVVGSDPYSMPYPVMFPTGNEVTIAVR